MLQTDTQTDKFIGGMQIFLSVKFATSPTCFTHRVIKLQSISQNFKKNTKFNLDMMMNFHILRALDVFLGRCVDLGVVAGSQSFRHLISL